MLADASPRLSVQQIAGMALEARLGPVDNVFQVTRRFMNALERSIGTSSGYNTVWHGYAPYDPKMLQQYLALFRCTYNYCTPGKDGRTPAMRLGLTDKRLDFNDVLWPGEIHPQPPVEIANARREDVVKRLMGGETEPPSALSRLARRRPFVQPSKEPSPSDDFSDMGPG